MSKVSSLLADLRNSLEPLRQWVDGEVEDAASEIGRIPTKHSRSEQFMLAVARELDRILKEEFVANRIRGTAYVPPSFVVFLSNSDDKWWSGEKRKFFGEVLGDIILHEAQKMCGTKLKLNTDLIDVEIRPDGTLAQGEVSVKPIAETDIDNTIFVVKAPTNVDETAFDPSGGTAGAKPLYFVQIEGRSSYKRDRIPVYKREVTIGRGSQTEPVDIKLEGEPRMSRVHASLRLDNRRKLWLTALGTNPTILGDRILPRNEPTGLRPNQKFKIYDFSVSCSLRMRKRRISSVTVENHSPPD